MTRVTVGCAEFSSFETEQDVIRGILVWSDASAEYYSRDIITDELLDEKLYAPQSLTEEEKAQARENIGAADHAELVDLHNKMKYSHISDETVTLQNGYFIYTNCEINEIPNETVLTGSHIFKDCKILGTLFLKGVKKDGELEQRGEYEFINCEFSHIRVVSGTIKTRGCIGNRVQLTGNCHNSVIENCKLTATIGAPIVLNGGVSDNVRICSNTVINHMSATAEGIESQCINTHGVSNSVIDGNYCELYIEGEENKIAIDISGHSGDGTIRSWNNVVRNNYVVNGNITVYTAKNIFVTNNFMKNLVISGAYVDGLDYGDVLVTGNTITNGVTQRVLNPSVNVTQNIVISGNTILGRSGGLTRYYKNPEGVKVYLTGNTFRGRAVTNNEFGATVELPREFRYIQPGEAVFIPTCYVYKSELSAYGLTEGTFYNGGFITNDSALTRYVIYGKTNSYNGQTDLWTQ